MMINTMNMEGESLFEGSSLGSSLFLEGPDVALFEGKVDVPFVEPVLTSSLNAEFQSNDLNSFNSDWLSTEMDLDLISQFLDDDNGTSIKTSLTVHDDRIQSTGHIKEAFQPTSPANSYDSGVSSPGSGLLAPTLELLDEDFHQSPSLPVCFDANHNNAPDFFDFPIHQAPLTTTEGLFNVFDLPGESIQTSVSFSPTVVNNSGCGFDDFTHNAIPSKNDQLNPDVTTQKLIPPTIASNEVNAIVQKVDTNFFSVEVLQDSPAKLSETVLKAPVKRKGKITNASEKKQRKRDQNKEAATRYREKKREEAALREEEFQSLDTKNNELRCKVDQVSREINCLKELMIEVYRIRGIIS